MDVAVCYVDTIEILIIMFAVLLGIMLLILIICAIYILATRYWIWVRYPTYMSTYRVFQIRW